MGDAAVFDVYLMLILGAIAAPGVSLLVCIFKSVANGRQIVITSVYYGMVLVGYWLFCKTQGQPFAGVCQSIILTLAGPFVARAAWPEQRLIPGFCPNCQYNLTGNISGTCPECGRIEGAPDAATNGHYLRDSLGQFFEGWTPRLVFCVVILVLLWSFLSFGR